MLSVIFADDLILKRSYLLERVEVYYASVKIYVCYDTPRREHWIHSADQLSRSGLTCMFLAFFVAFLSLLRCNTGFFTRVLHVSLYSPHVHAFKFYFRVPRLPHRRRLWHSIRFLTAMDTEHVFLYGSLTGWALTAIPGASNQSDCG